MNRLGAPKRQPTPHHWPNVPCGVRRVHGDRWRPALDGESMHIRSQLALPALVLTAGLAWSVVWGFNGQTDAGTLRVLGLGEGEWRAMLNPALVAVLAAALAWAASRPRSAGALIVVAGLGAMVAGNLLAFGLTGSPTPASAIGGPVFVAGAAAAVVGLALVIGRSAARLSGRRWLGVAAGVGTALVVGVMSIAAPPAAALALIPLADVLAQGRGATGEAPAPSLLTAQAQG
jgi:hypothetical protein